MAFKKDSKIKSNFTKITISLASPEEILEKLLFILESFLKAIFLMLYLLCKEFSC